MGSRRIERQGALLALQLGMVAALLAGSASPAFASSPSGHSRGGTSIPTGIDISYPQCGSTFPTTQAFGIVGVTGGLANKLNRCLGPSPSYPEYTESELYWAVASSLGGTSQPKASLYVNTGDPGNVYNGTAISDWPTSGTTPYGACATTTVTLASGTVVVGANSDACAWQYGYNVASQDATWLTDVATAINAQSPPVTVATTAGGYPWWLDVETANTWQSNTSMNVADLQGMIAGLQTAGASTVGAYSTSSQWNTITGGTTSNSGSLYQIPNWIPGARKLSEAKANCALTSFTDGKVLVTQWSSRPDDSDYACS